MLMRKREDQRKSDICNFCVIRVGTGGFGLESERVWSRHGNPVPVPFRQRNGDQKIRDSIFIGADRAKHHTARQIAIKNYVAQHERKGKVISFKRDFRKTAHGAMRAIAPDDVLKGRGLDRVIRMEQFDLNLL
jgi:hypothetical protein